MPEITATQPTERRRRKVRTGIVTSDKMRKTVVVRLDRLTKHPFYSRTIIRRSRVMAHDESNEAKAGDLVQIMETRPLSKHKRWRLVKVLERASSAPAVPVDPSEVAKRPPTTETTAPTTATTAPTTEPVA